jgi:mRNA-degrading endonuclease toxin of MazEF toxin-antitoxin module
MPRSPTPSRGDVWLVSLDPAVRHEVQKTRPAMVVKRLGRVRDEKLRKIDRSLRIVLDLL